MNVTVDDFELSPFLLYGDMSNRLFCTFAKEDTLEEIVNQIQDRYSIIYNKLFVLYSKQQEEYAITYNVDLHNIIGLLPDTILVHRKKESKTLYTINALNQLIRELNNGYLDTNYKLDWNTYRNCILLTKGAELKKIPTQLYKIVETVVS
jgi:hypothetical protein